MRDLVKVKVPLAWGAWERLREYGCPCECREREAEAPRTEANEAPRWNYAVLAGFSVACLGLGGAIKGIAERGSQCQPAAPLTSFCMLRSAPVVFSTICATKLTARPA